MEAGQLWEEILAGCIAVIVASGRGERFGGALPKQYLPLAGVPVLRHCLERLARHPGIAAVRAVIHPEDRDLYRAAAAGLDLLAPVTGGATRQESARLGLESLAEDPPARVLIHDGVRPLVAPGLINRVLDALDRHHAVVPAVPVRDTIKRGVDGFAVETVDRAGLFRAQTPQGFDYASIRDAHRAHAGAALTDDAALAAAQGVPVALVAGDEDNLKITEPSDFERAERIVDASLRMKVGMGFDVHRLVPGDGVVLLGVRLPVPLRLIGHSDADVGLHALTDALLGALGAGDIGEHFPPTDSRYRGADSTLFLRYASDLIAQRGGRIGHVDLTIICERPRIGPHRSAMTARVAELLALSPAQVSVKATTTEGLGFTGRGEGIAAQAVATVSLPA